MKLTAITTALFLSMVVSPVFAEVTDFSGFSASIGSGATASKADSFYSPNNSGITQIYLMGNTNTPKLIDVGFATIARPQFLIGLGASYDFGDNDNGSTTGIQEGTTYRNDVSSHGHYSIYTQPTYVINPTTAAFVKVGYHSTVLKNTDGNQVLVLAGSVPYSESSRVGGVGYGVGLKTFVHNNFYFQTEGQLVQYNTHTKSFIGANYTSLSTKLTSVSGIVSVGYHFKKPAPKK
ncbi:MAG: hypothetical protein V4490_00135 [Pseudomonadota bacterium]